MDNRVVAIRGNSNAQTPLKAADLDALFSANGALNKLQLANGGKAVILLAGSNTATSAEVIYAVGGANGTITFTKASDLGFTGTDSNFGNLLAASAGAASSTPAPTAAPTPNGSAIARTASSETAVFAANQDKTKPNDPLFGSQWALNNTGQRYTDNAVKAAALAASGGSFLDINVLDVWNNGITGKGVRMAVSDDGYDLNHEDLQINTLKDLTYNAVLAGKDPNNANFGLGATAFNDVEQGATNAGTFFLNKSEAHSHGTVVGSTAAMDGNNGKGMTGVSFQSEMVAAMVLPSTAKIPDPNDANKMIEKGTLSNADLPSHVKYLIDVAKVDISLNSYGADPAFSEDYNIAPGTPDANLTDNQKVGREIARGAKDGRDGKGIVFEFSAGNEKATKADSGLTNGTSSRYVVAVGSLDEQGFVATYGSRGANILVAGFGGDGTVDQKVDAGFGALAADVSGNLGYNTDVNAFQGNYSFGNIGTSYSGPMVGGVMGLMLQANNNLGFRDVAEILALTARGTGATTRAAIPDSPTYTTNNNYVTTKTTDWNLGGMHYSAEGAGYGLVDAAAAVRLSEQWSRADNVATRGTVANWKSAEATSATVAGTAIPDKDANGGANGLTVTATITPDQQNPNLRIDRMEFDIKLTAARPSELKAIVTSPNGTSIVIFDQPLSKDKAKATDAGTPDTAWPGVFTIGSTAFLGETSAGEWKLQVIDTVTGQMVDAKFDSFTVRAWGTAVSDDSQYTFTREYTSTNKEIVDAAGNDTINAAAVHKAVTLNLVEGATNSIGNDTTTAGTFTIKAGSVIENAIGGGGADTLVGNNANNILRGSWGSDTISGGAGNDTIAGGTGSDNLTGGDGNDTFLLTENMAAAVGTFLGDTITDFQDGANNVQDLLQFSVTALNRLATIAGQTAGSLVSGVISNAQGYTGAAGAQGANFLVTGATAVTANQAYAQFLYSSDNGQLAFDVDGTGSTAAINIAMVGQSKTLDAADFAFV
ncbi:MAG: S8 family serine peptidase [Limnobacter sp.]|nr:S8 family serine peptidase [Limnobacter sp.]